MSKQLFTNNAVSLLGSNITPGDTTFFVSAGTGNLYPNPNNGEYFLATLENEAATAFEIIKVQKRIGDEFIQVIRGFENTTPMSWLAGQTLVDLRETAGTFRRLQRIYDAEITITINSSITTITTSIPFEDGSEQVWVGGLRQKRGYDYEVLTSTTFKLLYPLSETEITGGQIIVVDFNRQI